MNCRTCDYALDTFDKVCPRCGDKAPREAATTPVWTVPPDDREPVKSGAAKALQTVSSVIKEIITRLGQMVGKK